MLHYLLALACCSIVLGASALTPCDLLSSSANASASHLWRAGGGSDAGRVERSLLTPVHQGCATLSKDLLGRYAKNGIILLAITDRVTAPIFGASWVDNVKTAGISYWMLAALDPETSLFFSSTLGVEQCFNAPTDTLRGKAANGPVELYRWGSNHWMSTTWLKVHVVRAVYRLGFHVLHCDLDSTWFADPIHFFTKHLLSPAQLLTSTDMTATQNGEGDEGLEVGTGTHTGINTGVYFLRQCPEGLDFLQTWLSWQDKKVGHDQDGLNLVMRGEYFGGHPTPGVLPFTKKDIPRAYFGAHARNVAVSFLPTSMFANQYTFANAQFHKLLNHTLYEVHWVWGGNTLESKRQSMRDATKFVDPPEYYTDPNLVSLEMVYPQLPEGFNSIPPEAVESMIQFHVRAVEFQLQQLYYVFALGVALNRTVLLPRVLCFCSKNWYMTFACRLDPDHTSHFPFTCALSQILRSKKLTRGYPVPDPLGGAPRLLQVREYSFLENQRTPTAIKSSRLTVQPTPTGRSAAASLDQLRALVPPLSLRPDGSAILSLPWPLSDVEVAALLTPHLATRVLHFIQPARLFGPVLTPTLLATAQPAPLPGASGLQRFFNNAALQFQFDKAIYAVTAYWCCRSPREMKALNETVRIDFNMVPAVQRAALMQWPNGLVVRGHNRPMYGRR